MWFVLFLTHRVAWDSDIIFSACMDSTSLSSLVRVCVGLLEMAWQKEAVSRLLRLVLSVCARAPLIARS